MSPQAAGLLQLTALIAALALAYRPLGDYMAKVYSSEKNYAPEKWIYKVIGANPAAEMRWPAYLRAVLAFSAVSVLFLYLLQRIQGSLPGSLGFSSIDPDQAFNTAASFVANTNWQSYYGEQAMGHVLVRGTVRILVPISVIGAIVLVACGAIQNFSGIHQVGQFMGGTQEWNGGAVASQEAIKELGTNG
uniref:potassium-transporting ATPase subunit KdpA n=1 Tax=Streptomyces griseus TaxID=1911 RepID=UPI0004C79292